MQKLIIFTFLALAFLVPAAGAAYADDASAPPVAARHHASLYDSLPKDKAALLHQAMDKAKADNKSLVDQERKSRDDLKAILTAPKFDTAAYIAKEAEIEQTGVKIKANTTAAFAGVLAQLTPEQRAVIAERHAHHAPHHWPNKTSGAGQPPAQSPAAGQ